jgi:uncharacterized membrane protein YphA (DoxX/SURF4 family)
MRLVSSIALFVHEDIGIQISPYSDLAPLHLFEVGTGVLLFIGLWTPVTGSLVVVLELWNTFSQPGDPWNKILVGTLGGALALLGPGAWSVDARLFGWKRIDVYGREK